jgi:hypothetical protein
MSKDTELPNKNGIHRGYGWGPHLDKVSPLISSIQFKWSRVRGISITYSNKSIEKYKSIKLLSINSISIKGSATTSQNFCACSKEDSSISTPIIRLIFSNYSQSVSPPNLQPKITTTAPLNPRQKYRGKHRFPKVLFELKVTTHSDHKQHRPAQQKDTALPGTIIIEKGCKHL